MAKDDETVKRKKKAKKRKRERSMSPVYSSLRASELSERISPASVPKGTAPSEARMSFGSTASLKTSSASEISEDHRLG